MTKLKDILVELIIGFLSLSILMFVLWTPDESNSPIVEVPSMDGFYDYPLQTWASVDLYGNPCIKVKYLVSRNNTRLFMYDSNGIVVHKTPLSVSLLPDGRERIETYVWKLHRTEWTPEIYPGTYQVLVGTDHDRRGLTSKVIVE